MKNKLNYYHKLFNRQLMYFLINLVKSISKYYVFLYYFLKLFNFMYNGSIE